MSNLYIRRDSQFLPNFKKKLDAFGSQTTFSAKKKNQGADLEVFQCLALSMPYI